MEIFACEQGSPEWFALRAGIPTASEFAAVLAQGRGGGPSKTRRTYMLKLAGERIMGEPAEGVTNAHLDRGIAMEPEARAFYSFVTDHTVGPVGFIKSEAGCGCSPDGLIGDDGMLEIKTSLPHLLADLLLADQFPPGHKAQVQGQLWIAEREWCDLIVYWPKMPVFIKRAHRDEKYIDDLARAVEQFQEELDSVVAALRAHGTPTFDPAPALVDATDLASAKPVF